MPDSDQPQTPVEKFQASADMKMNVDEVEEDLWMGSYSPKTMTGAWILAAVVSGAVLLIVLFTSLRNLATVWWIVVAALLIYWFILLTIMMYRKLSMHYELTTQRLKHREGIFVRAMDRIELIDIDDVTYRQGPIQAMMGVGNISIQSSDTSHPKLILHGISNIRYVADLIDDARRAERRKRGLHIESV